MKALITAAGRGVRMGTITTATNKCLLPVGGRSLLRRLVDTFKEKGISDIIIITGHCAELVEKELQGEATFIYNRNYSSTSILGSITLAEKALHRSDFIFCTGDSLLHPQLIQEMICSKNKESILLGIELKKCDEEDMKAIIKDNIVVDMGKQISLLHAAGEYTGLTYFPSAASDAFFKCIRTSLQQQSPFQYVAQILLAIQQEGFKLTPIYTKGLPRMEIDFPHDFVKAQELHTLFLK